MPYIKPEDRSKYDDLINQVVNALFTDTRYGPQYSEGDLNYFVSSVVWKIFQKNPRYANANKLMGALECIKLEFYRRQVSPYEDDKIKENGDVAC